MQESPSIPRPISVLAVDDDPAFGRIIQHHLQRYPDRTFDVTLKTSIQGAMAVIAERTSFDVILTDYNLHDGNGLEFCLQLDRQQNTIPIIFLTGVRDVSVAIDAMRLGAEDFIIKEDLGESQLPKAIVTVLDRVRTRKQLRAVEKRMRMAETRAQAIKELVVTVCHEFNNPLAAIKISADLVHRSILATDDEALLGQFEVNFKKVEREIVRMRDLNFERIDFHNVKTPPAGH
ncbi:MAG: response regulator [Bacteroidetes bacterium]|jgi:DNA-binding NarL/FixJ family response regulator|nr:response regulator [Bacteroidota bacterium]